MPQDSEHVRERKAKREACLKQGTAPYGERFLPIESLQAVLDRFEEGRKVRIAGRLMARRSHGKSTFCDLKDETARIQIYAKQETLSPEGYEQFSNLDLGDIVGFEGSLFTSKMGERTAKIEKFTLLSKILQVLPEKWHGLKDVETRYRQRSVDLMVNDEVLQAFRRRSQIVRQIRQFLDERGFLEVETPMMQPIPGGARAKPFVTHHEALGMDLYLRVAPELYLKRLLVGGMEKIYEINRNFRNEGLSVRHNPEFTMLELYQAYADLRDMMDITEDLISGLVSKIHGPEEIPYGEKTLNFKRPWKRLSFYDALKEKTGVDWRTADIRGEANKLKLPLEEPCEEADILDALFDKYLEPELTSPTFVVDYPLVISPLAKRKKEDPAVADRFELFISHMELVNAFSELNDPVEQRKRFDEQKKMIGEHKTIDEDFLMALEYGMPPAGGLGIGIDRLVMLLTNQHSIRDVVLFPQLRPEKES